MNKVKKCMILFLLGAFAVIGYFFPTILSNHVDHQDEETRTQMQFSSIDLAGCSVSNVVEKMKLVQEVESQVTLEAEAYLSDVFYQSVLNETNMLLSDFDIPFEIEDTMHSEIQFIYYLDILDSSKAILAWKFVILDTQNDVFIFITVDDATGQILTFFINDISGSLKVSISANRFDEMLRSYMEYLAIDNYRGASYEDKQITYGDSGDSYNLENAQSFNVEISKDGSICEINAAYNENGFYINYNK